MRFSLQIFSFCIASILLFSFMAPMSSVSLQQALKEKKISLRIIPTGNYSGNSINIEIKNISGARLSIELPSGTTFVPDNGIEQTLVAPDQEVFALGNTETKFISINAFCTEVNDHCPSVNSTFTLASTPRQNLQKLVHYLDSAKVTDVSVIQNSIWCVTDSENVSGIYGDDEQITALRKYVCSLTGQKETWYNTKSDVVMNEERQIVRNPTEVKGLIEFESATDVFLQGKIVDATGRVLFQNPNKTQCMAGIITFDFELRVEGWKKGTYSVIYTSDAGKEMLRQDFTI